MNRYTAEQAVVQLRHHGFQVDGITPLHPDDRDSYVVTVSGVIDPWGVGDHISSVDQAILTQLARIMELLTPISAEITTMAGELDRLAQQVQENTDAEASAVHLLGELSSLIRQNATDPARLTALADQLDQSADALAAAVLANTPSEGSA